jgi:hypothetical protein
VRLEKVTTPALTGGSGAGKSYHRNYPETGRHKKTTYPARVKWLFFTSKVVGRVRFERTTIALKVLMSLLINIIYQ